MWRLEGRTNNSLLPTIRKGQIMPDKKTANKKAEKKTAKKAEPKATTIDNIKTLAVAVKKGKAIISGVAQDGTRIRIEKVYKDRYGPSVSIK